MPSPSTVLRSETLQAKVDDLTERALSLLLRKITRRGVYQKEIQERLGWRRNYVSQILNRKKRLLLSDLYLILVAIEVDPCEYFGELFVPGSLHGIATTFNESAETPKAEEVLNLIDALARMGVIRYEDLVELAGAQGQ